MLQHQEDVILDESILNYLPSVNNRELASLTVSEILNHRSGLPRLSEEFNPGDWSNPFSDYSEQKLTTELENIKLDSLKSWSYSNLGYATLGRIIENTTSQDIHSLFNGLFSEIGLSESYIDRFEVPDNQLAKPSYLGIPFSYWDFAADSGYAGTIKSSSADLIKYLNYQIEQNSFFDSEKSVDSLYETGIGAYGKDQLFYKNGWFIFKPDQLTEIITHDGGTGGFHGRIQDKPSSSTTETTFHGRQNLYYFGQTLFHF